MSDDFFKCKDGCLLMEDIHRSPIDCWTQDMQDKADADVAKGPGECRLCGGPGELPMVQRPNPFRLTYGNNEVFWLCKKCDDNEEWADDD